MTLWINGFPKDKSSCFNLQSKIGRACWYFPPGIGRKDFEQALVYCEDYKTIGGILIL